MVLTDEGLEHAAVQLRLTRHGAEAQERVAHA
jgi:hypothetical protein